MKIKLLLSAFLIGSYLLASANLRFFGVPEWSNIKPGILTFTNCTDTTICSFASCQETVVLSEKASTMCPSGNLINYTWSVDLNNDGSEDIFSPMGSNSNEFSGTVAFGRHRIVFAAKDECGNVATCSYLFWIKDCKKPIPVCINGLSAPNMPSSKQVTILATAWESGSSNDNCCALSDLVYRVEKTGQTTFPNPPTTTNVTFGCDELGKQPVLVWIGDCGYDANNDGNISDDERNWDFCESDILIIDDDGVCPLSIDCYANFKANDEQGKIVNNCLFKLTNVGGSFSLISPIGSFLIPGTISCKVKVSNVKNPLNGVNTLDVIAISKQILGKQSLTSTYKKIAADVNKDQKITIADLIQIRQLILQIIEKFPNNDSWRFIDKSYKFTTNNQQAEGFPEFLNYNCLAFGSNSFEFVGVKIGDVDNTSNPDSIGAQNEVRSEELFSIRTEEQELIAGEEYTIDFRSNQISNIMGYQLTLGFDTEALDFIKFDGLSNDNNVINYGLTHLEEGLIPVLWTVDDMNQVADHDEMLSCRFKAKRSGRLSDFINMNSQLTPPIAYNKLEEGMNVEFEVSSPIGSSSKAFSLNQNTPNPFKGSTSIGFNLPEASNVTLTFYDISGRTIKSIKGNYPEGGSTIELQDTELNGTGIFYYKLETESTSAVKKMIIID